MKRPATSIEFLALVDEYVQAIVNQHTERLAQVPNLLSRRDIDRKVKIAKVRLAMCAKSFEQAQWISVEKRMPVGECFACYNKDETGAFTIIKAIFAKALSVEVPPESDTDPEIADYCEETNKFYLVPGWWEIIENWNEFRYISVAEYIEYWKPCGDAPQTHAINFRDGLLAITEDPPDL